MVRSVWSGMSEDRHDYRTDSIKGKMAELFAKLDKLGIKKKIIYPGKGQTPEYEDGTKVKNI